MSAMINALVLVIVLLQSVSKEVSAACGADLPHTKCERPYEKVGGFIEKTERVLTELLLNDRDCTSDKNDGHVLDWNAFTASVHSLACRCAEIAKEKGYKVFGLQFYGECWSGPSAEASFAKYGAANPSQIFQEIGSPPPPCDKTKDQECIGGPLVNYVYRLKDEQQSPDVDGGYSKWSDWTDCSKTCGGGVKGRERTCTQPKPDGNGKDCSLLGPAEETAACNEQACPDPDVDGKWSSWQRWSSCSATCGGGVRVRERTCDNPAPSGHGKNCEGKPEETGACAQDPCPIPCIKALDIGIILDGSGSVRERNFKIALGFIEDLITHFKVSADGTHFGFITYNHVAKVQFTMADTRYHDFVGLKARVKAIRYTGGWTRTDRALTLASTNLFIKKGGDRPDKPNILIVFTDGKTNRGSLPYPSVLRPLQTKGVRTVAVGIGRGIDNNELREIAMGNPHYVVQVQRFEELRDKLNIILADSCQGIQPPSPEPECTEEDLPLGMEDGRIPSASLTASSVWDANHSADRGRLNTKAGGGKTGAWSARYNDQGQYYQVDFGKAVKITKLFTQGRHDTNQWVTKYWLSYSQDNGVYKPLVYEKEKGKEIFVGNNDRNTVKSNKLKVPIFARYLRVHPWSWSGHISMRVEFYGCAKGFNPPVVPACMSALGLQSGAVADSKITASSEWDSNHRASNGRLYFQRVGGRTGGWSAKRNTADQWLQVDFGKIAKLQMVGTQGRADHSQWVVNYWITYSRDGVFWDKTDGIDQRMFENNSNKRLEHNNTKQHKTKTQHKTTQDNTTTQGNNTGQDKTTQDNNTRQRHNDTTTQRHDDTTTRRHNDTTTQRHNDTTTQRHNDTTTQRHNDTTTQRHNDTTTQRHNDTTTQRVFTGNSDRFMVVTNLIDPAIYGRYFRIHPKQYHGHMSMRAELYGCTSVGFVVPPIPCTAALGMQDRTIPDAHITASSMWDANHGPARARLGVARHGHKTGAWSARSNDNGQWLQLNLGKVTQVTRIALQGRQDHNQWVKSYSLQYSLDGGHFVDYQGGRILPGNADRNTVKGEVLDPPIIASHFQPEFPFAVHGSRRYTTGNPSGLWRSDLIGQKPMKKMARKFFRVLPKTWHGHISMRMEVYGCTSGFPIPPSPKCLKALGVESKAIKDSQMSASSEWDSNHGANHGRLHLQNSGSRKGAWSALRNNRHQWLGVDFGKVVKVTMFATQGRHDSSQWVKTYKLEYSLDGYMYDTYSIKGQPK
ncbi:hypothetical protein QZH41_010513 [Actinostola sp. cb2023]|nr:hypothetical protein QZH41_010513 [Actinostola sp. cb2023]